MRHIIMLIQVLPQFLNIDFDVKLKWGKKILFIHSFILLEFEIVPLTTQPPIPVLPLLSCSLQIFTSSAGKKWPTNPPKQIVFYTKYIDGSGSIYMLI